MEKRGVLSLEIGQLAEMKTFEEGLRGAWFRCEITDIHLKKNKIKPEYYDYPDEEITWAKIYEVPPYGIRKQLMVRPHYPVMYHKSEMPPVNSISQVCVVIDGTWKVEDLVDWHKDGCYWCARVINVLSDDKVQIELPMAPAGEGGTYEAFCKDLRPYLGWSPRKGWTLPTVEGQSSSSTQLIFPSKQGMDSEVENPSSGSRISVVEGDIVESSDNISNLSVEASDEEDIDYHYTTDLNIMHEETLAAPIIDLEELELANKIKRMKSLLQSNDSPTNQTTSWKFGWHKLKIWRKGSSQVEAADEENIDYTTDLNIMHEETLEAPIVDLEELANKIKRTKSLYHTNHSPTNQTTSWKFGWHKLKIWWKGPSQVDPEPLLTSIVVEQS